MQAAGSEGGGAHAAATYRGLRSRRPVSTLGEINVTPLVDVVLVLLLVFMVTAPMMSRGIDVSLPVADQPQIETIDRINVTIDSDERVYVNDKPVALVLLEDQIRGLMSRQTKKVAYLRGDERLR